MKLIVIGARGQVGQEFAKLVPPDDLVPLNRDEIDVTRPDQVHDTLAAHDCDAIVNLAAFHNVNGCEEDPAQAFASNATGAWHVAAAAAHLNRTVVYISSDYVFGGETHRESPYLESDSPAPLNVYGASKAAGENLVRAANPAGHLIIRTSSLYGCVTSKKGSTFPELMLRKARDGESLRVVDDQIMAPTYTYDLTKRVVELLERGARGTFHVANRGSCSWYAFARRTLELAGIGAPIEAIASDAFPSPARRPSYSVLDTERLEEADLGPMRPWEEAVEAYLVEKGEIEKK